MNHIHPLKFASEAEYRALIAPLPEWLTQVETIVEVGVVVKAATFDEEGNELTPSVTVDGWHVDILAPVLIPELVPYCLEKAPQTPAHGVGWGEPEFIIVTKTS
jgi:hypothetical protein